MNVPNHSQTSRIRFDIQAMQNGQTPKDWRGNSYAGVVGYPERAQYAYTLIHWSTPIAQLVVDKGVVSVEYFNARYISSTTRSFQGRIVNALATALGENHAAVVRIREELALPTGEREQLHWAD